MWNPILAGWARTLFFVVFVMLFGLAGCMVVQRWPRMQALWTTTVWAGIAYIPATWLGTLLNVHAGRTEALILAQHLAAILVGGMLATFIVGYGARRSRS